MKILLIGPTALDYFGNPIKQGRIHLPGLTLPMLASVTPPEASMKLISETAENIPFDEHWDLVGLTGMGSGIVRAWQIADIFREKNVLVVIGGIAATLGGAASSLQHADAVVLGEGEDIWPIVVQDAAAGRLKNVYQATNRPNIDTLPVPRYDLMNKNNHGVWRPVQATRGCPFPCNFCSISSFFEQSYRKRPVRQVIRDVREAKRHGTKYIAFIDDNIGVDFEYSANLWDELIPEKIIWMSQCSIHIADKPEMLKLAYQSGCRMLSFGIESTNAQSLKQVDKEWNNPTRYGEAIRRIKNAGIEVSTEMIIGLDGDDKSVFQKTYNFIMDNQISVPRVHILTPVPGTPLYKELEIEGRIISQDHNRYSGGQVVYRPRHINPDELQNGYWKLYQQLFKLPSIYKRIRNQGMGHDAYMRFFVLAVNLHYKNHIKHKITPGIV